ncbi:hypothetical protein DSO57_1021345 [Entomophthora muscae]|uniref:Uncharacterized protein n=1 Tax=Entomophthora muscae TaxID=34485 RepID=A0ACC2SSJ8_9FUNG|nr:hypothetical protein DSO57_1021345 [Entomophthora muscae]
MNQQPTTTLEESNFQSEIDEGIPLTSVNISKNHSEAALSEDEEQLEQEHFKEVVSAYRYYGYSSVQDLRVRKKNFDDLVADKPDQVRYLSSHFFGKLREVAKALQENAHFLSLIVEDHDIFHNSATENIVKETPKKIPSRDHMDKVSTTLRMFVRDWSSKGAKERETTYQPILDELVSHFSHVSEEDRPNYKVAVPGAGLGRLAYEVAKLGFSCQGNEFSYFMLLASSFILNNANVANQFTIFPYANAFSNHMCIDDQILPVQVPDIVASEQRMKGDFSMSAGDFLEVYAKGSSHTGQWDAIITCFFIDTAKNVADYIETIYSMLKPGGAWINLGSCF